MSDITVFAAKKIITMDPNCPVATHVAVKDGRILAVGGADCADPWGTVVHDHTMADAVLMPGLVEGHAHMMSGAMWRYAYVGYHDRIDPQGKMWHGLSDVDAVIARLRDYAEKLEPDEPLVAWGFDPIFLDEERLNKTHLDQISKTRPIAIIFSNFHLMCVNSASLALAAYDAGTNAEGVMKGPDGTPNGELQEMAAMFPVMRRLGIDFRGLSQDPSSIRSYAEVAKRAGVTTATDLYSQMQDEDLEVMLTITGAPEYPLRIVPAIGADGDPVAVAERALAMRARSTDKLRLGAVKLMTDGAIQGWTARVKWPGYVGGQPNGIWNTAPEQIAALCLEMQRRGVQMHIHVNGDEAAEVTLDALEAAARASVVGPPPCLAALPDDDTRAVCPRCGIGCVLQYLCQSHLLFRRQACRDDDRTRPGGAYGRCAQRFGSGYAYRAPFGRAGDAFGADLYRMVCGEPPNHVGRNAGCRAMHHRARSALCHYDGGCVYPQA